MRYRLNAPHVMAETIGGETIIVNLTTGHYFNLQGSGVEVWEAIAQGEPVSAVISRLRARYDAPEAEIETSVSQLVEELRNEELVAMDGNGDNVEVLPAAAPTPEGERQPFIAPSLAKFTDMQDIILLDPVHEVDARGWPHAPASA
jgi:hypothetical protein